MPVIHGKSLELHEGPQGVTLEVDYGFSKMKTVFKALIVTKAVIKVAVI